MNHESENTQPVGPLGSNESPRQHGPWQIRQRQLIYRDPWLSLEKDDVFRPDGQPGTYSVVRLKPGVSVIALDDQDNVHLTREFHYAVGRETIEAVSGGIEEGEDPLTSGRRELLEELGITAAHWTDLGEVDPFTAAIWSPTRLYLARQLGFETPQTEATELIQRVEMPLGEAINSVFTGVITHAPSCVALLKIWWMQQTGQLSPVRLA